jgi:alpha-ketoglutarate-dependent taurine dioxygenase
MQIEAAAPRIGAIVTGIDVRSMTEEDWKRLYQTWLDRHVLTVRGQKLSKPPLRTLEAASGQAHARPGASRDHVDGCHHR